MPATSTKSTCSSPQNSSAGQQPLARWLERGFAKLAEALSLEQPEDRQIDGDI